jgi:hypothetical protein
VDGFRWRDIILISRLQVDFLDVGNQSALSQGDLDAFPYYNVIGIPYHFQSIIPDDPVTPA